LLIIYYIVLIRKTQRDVTFKKILLETEDNGMRSFENLETRPMPTISHPRKLKT